MWSPAPSKGVSRRIVCTFNGLQESVRMVRDLVRDLVRAREKSSRIKFKTASGGDDRVR